MYVDFWILSLFSILFGICAWWNRSQGIKHGIELTLGTLLDDKIIQIKNDKVVPGSKKA